MSGIRILTTDYNISRENTNFQYKPSKQAFNTNSNQKFSIQILNKNSKYKLSIQNLNTSSQYKLYSLVYKFSLQRPRGKNKCSSKKIAVLHH